MASIYDCFDLDLPDLVLPPEAKFKLVSSSSKTTRGALPVKMYVNEKAETHLKKAKDFLEKPKVEARLLKERHVYDAYPNIKLTNEAGVVAGSMAYIIMPLVAALHSQYGNRFEVTTEDTHSETYEDVSGDTRKIMVRTDLVFQRVPDGGGKPTVIAVIEYKRRGVIAYNDYAFAILDGGTTGDEINAKLDPLPKTRLQGNAERHGMQTCTYAASTKCKHIALFNWDHLLIFHYYLLGEHDVQTAGDYAGLTWATEGDVQGTYVEQAPIRKVLLGWLLMAFEEAFNGPSTST